MKKIMVILLFCIAFISLVVSTMEYFELNEMSLEFMKLRDEYYLIVNKYDKIMGLVDDLMNLTYSGGVIKIEEELGFSKWSSTIWRRMDFSTVLYIPVDNSSLELYLWAIFPEGRIEIPLCIQEGRARRREEATDIWREVEVRPPCGAKEGMEMWREMVAPIIWRINATEKGRYSIPIPHRGWYTVSLLGPIVFNPVYWEYAGPIPQVEGSIYAYVLINVRYKGRFIPFIVYPT
ncbi:MAG: hypothetical protein QW638_04990 [Candidatus Bathyarchaeia archaeon]|nr:hypothetical protein [Candidatus Bathyarchaeota archaeon]